MLTVVTVTWNTWETWTGRLFDQFFHFVSPDEYTEWIVVDNDSDDGEKIYNAMPGFPKAHWDKFRFIRSSENIRDLPQYNHILRDEVKTEKVVCLSTDMRILPGLLTYFSKWLDDYDMVGNGGRKLLKVQADRDLGGRDHWIAQLLVDRGIEFENTAHIQSHAFGIRRSAFLDVGGFWTCPGSLEGEKGDLIAGEVILGVKLRQAGYKLRPCFPPMYHYGNNWSDDLSAVDREFSWPGFPVRFGRKM